jgi:hypothetical protein
VTLSTPGAVTVVLASAGYLVAIALLGFGLGAMIRHSAGGITSLLGLVLVMPLISGALPAPWNVRVERLLPNVTEIVARHATDGMFSPGSALLVCAVWAAAALVGASFLVTRRDA